MIERMYCRSCKYLVREGDRYYCAYDPFFDPDELEIDEMEEVNPDDEACINFVDRWEEEVAELAAEVMFDE